MADLRNAPRLPIVLTVRAGEQLATTGNVSEGGMFIETDEVFAPGQVVEMKLSFPGLLAPVALVGRVAWSRPRSETESGGIGVTVPLEEQAREPILALLVRAALADKEPLPAPDEPFRILIADDSPNSADMYGYALRKLATNEWGASPSRLVIQFASDGDEAWRRLQREKYPLVLTDLYMPVMNGFTLIEKIRAEPKLSETRILVISAADEDALSKASRLGADGVVHKPAQIVDLIFTVRALLRL